MRRPVIAALLVMALALPLIATQPLAPPHAGHAADPNDHTAMYAGGIPGAPGVVLPLQSIPDCNEAGECIEAAGLGDAPPARSYVNERPLDMTIYRTNDGIPSGPDAGRPSCHPQHKDTHEVGIFLFYDLTVTQYHSYGPPAPGAATQGCVRWHAQADERFVGRQIGQVGLTGTGARAPVALIHGFTIEVPNPCYGKPCANGIYTGRYLHFEGKLAVFQIAVGSGGEVWYIKQIGSSGYSVHLNGHTFGQDRVPFYPTNYAGATGPVLGMQSASDGAFQWNTCGVRAVKRPGDEGVPCVKSVVDAARGSWKGKTVQNPNVVAIPSDRFGNRLVPLSYQWVKCLDDQAAIPMPPTTNGDGAALNPHEWAVQSPARILGYAPPACVHTTDLDRATTLPVEGMKGVPNAAPAPEPTGSVPTDTPAPEQTPLPTFAPTDTPTPEPATVTPTATETVPPAATDTPTATIVPTATRAPEGWREVAVADTVHWFRGAGVYEQEVKPQPWSIVTERRELNIFYGDRPPADAIPHDDWTAVWYGTWPGGPIQAIRVRCDDECRVVLNDVVEHDGVAFSTVEIPITHLDTAPVPFRVEHRDTGGDAYLRVEFVRPPPPPTVVPTETPVEATEAPVAPTEPPVPTPDDTPPLATPNTSTTMTLTSTEPTILQNMHLEWIPRPTCQGGATAITDEPWSFNYAADALPHNMPTTFCILARNHVRAVDGRCVNRFIVRSDDGIALWLGHRLVFDFRADPPYAERVVERMPDGQSICAAFPGGPNPELNLEYHNWEGRALSWVYAESD